ncbi:putative sodium-coupled neutral amino acid transporter 10 [Orchesella cincta]|uniref:Putative sodium-coupled neutral amino acid transporter 10 n=1 Tax=Orchesella cincta TaxID=48709 RepID=A0A1D2N5E0_ORCCI|nr:putative sodium-coupled neutral amino acid transporter 10 [Orchesella cincta]
MVSRHVVTLANSIVGVSVLAMPFCFKQCGIVLATLSLMIGAVMTRMVCYFLVKAAIMNRRRTYELLAWSTFGQTGKFMVEIGIIGFLIGTLIAFMVVIGDLGPEILSEIFSMENNSSLRTIIMTALSLFVALPLGLLRNIDSLSSVSTASVLFYLFLLIKIFSEGIGPLWSGEYLDRIHFWRSGGVLQCIPIFSMALSCQTQIFGIYDALPDPSLQKMNEVVKQAVNLCTFFYFCVGFFGYIAFSHQNFGGNILLSFTPTWSTQLIKSMFLMSVVFSVPLVVFPCRVSLNSLIFKSVSTYHHVHDMSTNYIPESRMKFLTVTIVAFTLIIGIIIPNIELVLGLVGSTTGSVICIIFPSIMFVKVTSKSTTEKLVAQAIFCIGVVLMLLTTYATLYAAEQSQVVENIPETIHMTEIMVPKPVLPVESSVKSISKLEEHIGQVQQIHHVEYEPKIPEKMISNDNQRMQKVQNSAKVNAETSEKKVKEIPQPSPSNANIIKEKEEYDKVPRKVDKPPDDKQTNERVVPEIVKAIDDKIVSDKTNNEQLGKQSTEEKKPEPDDTARKEVVDQKMDSVIDDTKKDFVDKNVAEAFLKRLEEHQENQKKLLEEQKEILQELKEHHAQDVRDKLEKDKQKDDDAALVLPEDGPNKIQDSNNNNNEVKQGNEKSGAHVPETADKLIKEQEKIIEKISENIEKENKNAQLLEKLEEGLNNEVKKVEKNNAEDAKSKAMPIPAKDLSEPRNMSSANKQAGLSKNKIPLDKGRETLKGFDKERGVLVGSLGSSRRGSETGDKEEADKSVSNNMQPAKVEPQKDAQKPPNVKTADEIANKNAPLIQKTLKNSQKVEISSPEPSKKTVSESKPKEKVDREI